MPPRAPPARAGPKSVQRKRNPESPASGDFAALIEQLLARADAHSEATKRSGLACAAGAVQGAASESTARFSPTVKRQRLLDGLFKLASDSYRFDDVSDEEMFALLSHGCRSCPVEDDALCMEFCSFVAKACRKRKLHFTGHLSLLENLAHYFYQAICRENAGDRFVATALRATAAVVHENGVQCNKMIPPMLPAIISMAQVGGRSVEVRRMAIHCLGNFCVRCSTRISVHYPPLVRCLISNLSDACAGMSDTSPFIESQAQRKLACSVLRSTMLVIMEDKTAFDQVVPEVVDNLKRLCFYGMPRLSAYSDLFTRLRITSHSAPRLRQGYKPYGGSYAASKEYSARRSFSFTSSDSDLSDASSGSQATMRGEASRIQHNALLCLRSFAKATPKQMLPYWSAFLPESSGEGAATSLLLGVIAFNSHPSLRIAGAHAVSALVDGSKKYLAAAEESVKKTSFTSLSQRLGSTVRELHNGLLVALATENDGTILVPVLQCCEVVVTNTTYSRLYPGHLVRLFQRGLQFVNHSDQPVRLFAVKLLSRIMEVSEGLPEGPSMINYSGVEVEISSSNLVETAMEWLTDRKSFREDVEVIEICRLVCNAVHFHFSSTSQLWSTLDSIVQAALNSSASEALQAAHLQIVAEYARGLSGCGRAVELPWWISVMDRYIQPLSTSSFPALRALVCDCLSHLGSNLYEELPRDRQVFCTTVCLGSISDEDSAVKSAACRALGVMVQFPALREDLLFVVDLATTLVLELAGTAAGKAAAHPTVDVRLKAGWALANLCDSLVVLWDQNGKMIPECFTEKLLVELLQTSIQAANDNDKLKPNAARVLGSVMKIAEPATISFRGGSLVQQVIAALISCIDTAPFKARWNACHACCNMLQNQNVPVGCAPWSDQLFKSLARAASGSKNLKVRINAAQALASPSRREQYGSAKTFAEIVEALASALENGGNTVDASFAEFRYVGQLKNQLRYTLCHLRSLSAPSDDSLVGPIFQRLRDTVSDDTLSVNSVKAAVEEPAASTDI